MTERPTVLAATPPFPAISSRGIVVRHNDVAALTALLKETSR